MNISVNNLDLGYEQCANLNNLVKGTGEGLLQNLAITINNLKSHWIGSDASNYINDLITVYKAFGELLSNAKTISADAGEKIIAIQTVRNANGGGGNIGSQLSNEMPNITTIDRCEPTSGYYVDPSAKTDYIMLQDECTNYNDFINKYRSIKNELLSNWTDGANREQAVANFSEFDANSDTYYNYLVSARDNLGVAVTNLSQL